MATTSPQRRGRRTPAAATALGALAAVLAPAGTASANTEPLEGVYTRTITTSSYLDPGTTNTITFTPCGPDCTHWQLEGGAPGGFNLYRQGTQWMRPPDGSNSLVIIDATTLTGTATSTDNPPTFMAFTLTKNT